MTALIILAVVVAVAIAGFLLLRGGSSNNSSWQAGPTISGTNYSAGVSVDASGSFTFPLAPDSIHDVTKVCGSLAGAKQITLRCQIGADSGVRFEPISDPSAPSVGPVLYFQRQGDDWSGAGEFEAYRWWATFAAPMPITPGVHEIVTPFSGRWSAVETSNSIDSPQAFADALANAARVGFTFGGGTGYGHGVFATGNAKFTLLAFEISQAATPPLGRSANRGSSPSPRGETNEPTP